MPATKIMLIRHAEKPSDKDAVHTINGVSAAGMENSHELIVRGWQRSGALVRFFAPRDGHFVDPRLAQPKTVFASVVGEQSKSLRPQHTVLELATVLQPPPTAVPFILKYAKGEEAALATAAVAATGPVLIAWEHEEIPDIVNAIVGNRTTCPQKWHGSRFDLVWMLDRPNVSGPWIFSQVPQMLLSGDSEELI